MSKQFIPFDAIADYNYGVKGFEVRFQDEIERVLEENGLEGIWWKYYSSSIFEEVFEIYAEANNGDYELLFRLSDLYDKIIDEVSERIHLNKIVTMDDRIEESVKRYPELKDFKLQKESSRERENERNTYD